MSVDLISVALGQASMRRKFLAVIQCQRVPQLNGDWSEGTGNGNGPAWRLLVSLSSLTPF
jgi:hypothetical protein